MMFLLTIAFNLVTNKLICLIICLITTEFYRIVIILTFKYLSHFMLIVILFDVNYQLIHFILELSSLTLLDSFRFIQIFDMFMIKIYKKE